MRGSLYTGLEERRRLFYILDSEICRKRNDKVDMIPSNLCLRDCVELFDELGYVADEWTYDSEEIWVSFRQKDCPMFTIVSDGYLGTLNLLYNPDSDDANEEKIKELMKTHWGKYFPVI